MKNPQDLCQAEYRVYRRQVQEIRILARKSQQRPSEVLRILLDQALENQRLPYPNGKEVILHG